MIYFFLFFSIIFRLEATECPNLTSYYEILKKSYGYYEVQNWKKAFLTFKKIEKCPRFSSTEKNLYFYAKAILNFCKLNNNKNHPLCIKNLARAENLLYQSIALLPDIKKFKKEIAIRYFDLGVIYILKKNCSKAIRTFYFAFHYDPTLWKANWNYKHLKKLCTNSRKK